ncbi:major facilitator superfamily domain-containing protein [Ditylenchus destructor]|uniref:Major facilitator superfamily domain-containing protein n=1 Tax=Ditylenchus destructor TaxID=166010 RepID=A0AAD4R685_9BILA|nr:major facilitator superfamily domain-containing protein [Ditylenchus destructor]
MLTLNFTIICMDPLEALTHNITVSNYNHPIHRYTQTEKTILQWTVAIASAVATFPFSWICSHYGARHVFVVFGFLSAISTGAIPLAAEAGFGWFIFVRIWQGLAYACDFAVVGVMCTRWASLRENAKFLAVLTCFSSLASLLTNVFSGMICDSSFGWPWVHYSFALASLFLFVLWFFFYTDEPHLSPFMAQKELSVIHMDKSDAHKVRERYVPYKAILKSKVVWTVWINAFAVIFSEFFLFIYAPTYIKNVLGYSTTETGFMGALVALAHIPFKMVSGYVSDTFHCLSERHKMWFFNTVALVIPALIYVYLCYAPSGVPALTVILFCSVQAALGFNSGGYYKCGALVSRQYAEFVIAFTQFIKCLVFFVAPALVAIFVQDDRNATQWHVIFYIIAATLIFANVIFCVYATNKPASFTALTLQSKRESKLAKANGTSSSA